MPFLFDPLRLRDVTLRNRIMVAPMCQYAATDGVAGPWHLVHYGSLAVGGAGLVVFEATAVEPRGRIGGHDLGIWRDDQAEALAPLAAFVADQGAVPAIQLAHAGRKASTARPWEGGAALPPAAGGWEPVAPSAVPFGPAYPTPRALSGEEIADVPRAFAAAAARSRDAGFRAVELHAAHGYLLHEFLSPLANRRTDRFGGSFENRARLLLETVDAVRRTLPDSFPVLVRISATDWAPGGWDVDESVELCRLLAGRGVDLVDVSSGGMVPDAAVPVAPGYQVPAAGRVRREAGVPVAAVGLITDAAAAEAILREGDADLIAFGRELLRDPRFPQRAARALGADLPWPAPYLRAKPA